MKLPYADVLDRMTTQAVAPTAPLSSAALLQAQRGVFDNRMASWSGHAHESTAELCAEEGWGMSSYEMSTVSTVTEVCSTAA